MTTVPGPEPEEPDEPAEPEPDEPAERLTHPPLPRQ